MKKIEFVDLVKEHKIMNDGLNVNSVILTFNEVKSMSDEEIIFLNKKTSMFAKWKNIKALELFEERICKINKINSIDDIEKSEYISSEELEERLNNF